MHEPREAESSGEANLELDLPAVAASVGTARDAAAELARQLGADEDGVKLAVSEAVGNCVVHAFRSRPEGSGTIKIHSYVKPGTLLIVIADDGIGMTPNLDSPGLGMGISLITKLSFAVNFDSSNTGTTVSMEFKTG